QREVLVRVWGMDADGKPFFQNTKASNLNSAGASINGLERPLKVNEVIGLQFENQKTRVRVAQVGDAVLPGKMHATVEIGGGQPCPWAGLIDNTEVVKEEKVEAPSGSNKRRFPRLRANFGFELRDERGGGTAMRTHAADISGRGCYVETLVPLPLGTPLSI